MLIVTLTRNSFMSGLKCFRALVQSVGTLTQDQMIERMMRRGSTVTAADASAVLRDYFYVSEDLLLDGHRIKTPFGTLALTIRGRFDSETEAFNPDKHQVVLTLQTSAAFRRQIRDRVQVQRRRANVPQPNVTSYWNLNNGDQNNTLTPGGGAHLFGELLNFDQDDLNQGIFIIPVSDGGVLNGEDEPSRVEIVLHNSSRKLAFLVPPDLAAGEYVVEVRKLFGNETIRTGTLEETLVVV